MFKYYINSYWKGEIMSTNKELKLEQQVENLTNQVSNLKNSNSQLLDEVAVLKNNYNRLVEDVGERFKAVHEKLFR